MKFKLFEEYGETISTKKSGQELEEEARNFVQWAKVGTNSFMPTSFTKNTLTAGVYTVEANQQGYYVKKILLNIDDIIELSNPTYQEIVENIVDFYGKGEHYLSHGYNHKRGILMYGRPGNGKTFIINKLVSQLVEEQNVVVLYFPKYADMFEKLIYNLREVEPDRKILVIMEDLDGLMQDSMNKSVILNLLDGIKQMNNICYLATTNYPERLEENIVNRPSRFDQKYEVTDPTAEDRKLYFEAKINEDDIKKLDLDIKKLVKDSDGFTMSHLKEFIISLVVYEWDYDKALTQLKSMGKITKESLDKSRDGSKVMNQEAFDTYCEDDCEKSSERPIRAYENKLIPESYKEFTDSGQINS